MPDQDSHSKTAPSPRRPAKPSPANPIAPSPSPSTDSFIIKIPGNQIHRVPPPSNNIFYVPISRPNSSRRQLVLCCFYSLIIFVILLAIAATVSQFVFFSPNTPRYTVTFSVKSLYHEYYNNVAVPAPSPSPSFEYSQPSTPYSPQFNITFTAIHPHNNRIGIRYQKPVGSVQVYYKHSKLSSGLSSQVFHPGTSKNNNNNVAEFRTMLEGRSAMELTSSVHDWLAAAMMKGTVVPLKVYLRTPVRFKVGSVKTWTMHVKVQCHITVKQLMAESRIVSNNCHYCVRPW